MMTMDYEGQNKRCMRPCHLSDVHIELDKTVDSGAAACTFMMPQKVKVQWVDSFFYLFLHRTVSPFGCFNSLHPSI